MENYPVSSFTHFYQVGIDHHTAPVEIREGFALNEEQASHLIYDYKQSGGDGMLILSTCNRSEIYGFGNCPRHLIDMYCHHTGQSLASFQKYQVVRQNREAIEHLLRVGSGLESKILGDFEIIGQVKKAHLRSQNQGVATAFINRLVHATIQCSKQVKNQTTLSTGATSVAFAAVTHIKDYLKENPHPQVLVLGMGKMGRTTCENLVNQTGLQDITLINRTGEKAERLAERFQIRHEAMSHLPRALRQADVIIVATGASEPTVLPSHLPEGKPRLILDLSMPRNVHARLYQRADLRIIDVDQLAAKAQESIAQRQTQVPKAEALVHEATDEFYLWLQSRKVAPTLLALREKMEEWSAREVQNILKKDDSLSEEQAQLLTHQLVKRITGQFARGLKADPEWQKSLQSLHTIFELSQGKL